jgi:YHS domain-containing protein
VSLIRLIISFIIIYLAYKVIKGFISGIKREVKGSAGVHSVAYGREDLVEDPYCHTYIPVSNAYETSFGGKTLYFCGKKCFENYMKDHLR